MLEYILLIIAIFLLIITFIASNYSFILTTTQSKEVIAGGILSIILFGLLKPKLLRTNITIIDIIVPASVFIIWFLATKITCNLINKDIDYPMIRDTKANMYKTSELVISTILLLFLLGFVRTILLNQRMNAASIILLTVLYFIWKASINMI